MAEFDPYSGDDEHDVPVELDAAAEEGPRSDRPPLPTQLELIGDPNALQRDELARDRQAVNGIVKFLVEGRPPIADSAKERFRRNEQRLLGLIAATGLVPRQGIPYQRLAELVQEARQKTANIEAISRLPYIGMAGSASIGRTRSGTRGRYQSRRR